MMIFLIKEIRVEKNLSLENLSIKSSVNLGYLSQLERGEKQNPSIITLCNIANALNVNVKDLFYTVADIDDLRNKLHKSIEEYGYTNEKTVKLSNMIDLLSNETNEKDN